ncbi:MAG: HlyD family type I secretion periplasmic adaptor subunit [Maritimibacter sp.]
MKDTKNDSNAANAWSARFPVTLGLIALLVLIGGFGTWSVTSQIAGAIIAPGAIEVEQNRQVVQHPDGGVVEALVVREGDTVAAGDVLIRLDAGQIASELSIAENQLFELMARRGRLEAERDDLETIAFDPLLLNSGSKDAQDLMDGQVRLFEQRRENLASEVSQLGKRIGQIGSQNEGIAAQQAALDKQLVLITRELSNKQTLLDKGLAQSSAVMALEREEAAILGQRGELIAELALNEGRRTEIDIEILKIRSQRREEAIQTLRDLGYRELELAERLRALTEQMGRLDIRAPLAGIVHAMQVFAEREVVQPAQPVLYIVPQDKRLVIGVRVDPIHVDEIRVGQDVTLRFSAFDSRTTAELTGRVVTISADTLVDEVTGQSYYRARIELLDGELEKLPEDAILIPGMPVEAFLRTDDRSPLSYLVEPLSDYFNKAFRES